MGNLNITRGYGLLERFLARKRAQKANDLIPNKYRGGRVLDIGSGPHPLFLLTTSFSEKFGIDRAFLDPSQKVVGDLSMTLIYHDIESEGSLPFNNEYFDVVTMLAVFEHIAPQRLPKVFHDVHRVLKNGGILIITTPASWTGFILRGMAMVKLVSNLEIGEHKKLYTAGSIIDTLQKGGFSQENIRYGNFELSMNTWTVAQKQNIANEP